MQRVCGEDFPGLGFEMQGEEGEAVACAHGGRDLGCGVGADDVLFLCFYAGELVEHDQFGEGVWPYVEDSEDTAPDCLGPVVGAYF